MENLTKIVFGFCKADIRRKLKECQGIWTQSYQHLRGFVEGDKVWFQPLNGNSWLRPGAVLCQRGQSVWLHLHSYIRKVVTCRVKPYELVNRENTDTEDTELKEKRQVMLEDGLQEVENLYTDLKDDSVGASYLKMAQYVSCLGTLFLYY